MSRVPTLGTALAEQVVNVISQLRGMDLRKPPSLSETSDWAEALVALNVDTLSADILNQTMGLILKRRSDVEKAARQRPSPL